MTHADAIFSDRISDVPRSFIREILKTTVRPEVISFAGGLPNRDLFPVAEIEEATLHVLRNNLKDSLQYSTSEGYLPLREYIAARYQKRHGLAVHPDEILITNGSQQGLDLLGKILLNEGDHVILEKPSYLGAIQALSLYQPRFETVPLLASGADIAALAEILQRSSPKLFYSVPNFQNPSGISYDDTTRRAVADILRAHRTFFIEDDPYGELRFRGKDQPSFRHYIPEQTILLGSFSKIVVPSFRLGWIVAPAKIMERLVVAKQAADLHTNFFCQKIIHRYLTTNDVDVHIATIRAAYGRQCDAMLQAMRKYFPPGVSFTEPEGGMFIWATLPEGQVALQLFDKAIQNNVAFVPGNPFYVTPGEYRTMRLNFSCVDPGTINAGIQRLGAII
ncbi:MAG: PLP-dependent aminotransferase family protein [Spirochaetes bacterium]|nr:PLP-dependent aminotransferase family protein [Spirochaetota bacterium]MBX3723654.1 PLP-dependent aminotransferase family protein [Turneriella sp.]